MFSVKKYKLCSSLFFSNTVRLNHTTEGHTAGNEKEQICKKIIS